MKRTRIISSLALLAALTACSKKDSAEHYQDAQNYIANQQYSAAIIELRSAIQQDPDAYRFRMALGLALKKSGDIASAERELERALRYGAPEEDIALLLVQTHYLNSNHAAAIAAFSETDTLSPRTRGLVDSYRALSEIELGDSPAGLLHFENLATSSYPDIAALAQAHLKLSSQETEQALSYLSSIDDHSELYTESLYLRGKIQLSQDNMLESIAYLETYVEQAPSMHLARLLLSQAYVRAGKLEEGEKQLNQLLRMFPDQPMANYLQSLVRFQQDDFEAAKEHSEKAIRHGLVGSRARVIAAISSVRLGLESQALRHLEPIRDQLYNIPDAQRLYILLQLRAGETEAARNTLASMPENERNLQLVATTASELVRQGSMSSAEDLLSQYERQAPLDASGLTTIGTIRLGIDSQREAGIRDLERALDLDPSINQTRLVLAMTYLQQGEFEKASELANQWIQDPEMQVAGYNLKAYASFLQQRFDDSMQLTNQALQIKPLNPFSSLLQAMVHVQRQDLDTASKQLRTMLDQHPQYLAGLEQYYAVGIAQQDTADAANRIAQLFQQNEQIYPARLLLARVSHEQQNFQKVVDLLSDISSQGQTIPVIHHLLLVESLQQLGRLQAAVQAAERWHRQQPQNVQAGYTYANALTLNNERDAALDLLNRLLSNHPNHPRLIIGQITLLAQLDRMDQAVAVINNLPAEIANSPELQFIKGRLELMRGNSAISLQAFQNSYAELPTHETAMFIAVNLANSHSEQRAKSFVERHIEQHGSNQNLDTYHATLLLKTDAEQSMHMYKTLLEQEPNNVVALNNYAWLLNEQGQAAAAKPYAERAMELVPNHPDIIDTYGKILLRLNQPQEALKQFEQSLNLRPEHVEVLLNYAEALAKTNQPAKARDVLSQIRSDDPQILARKSQLQNQLQ